MITWIGTGPPYAGLKRGQQLDVLWRTHPILVATAQFERATLPVGWGHLIFNHLRSGLDRRVTIGNLFTHLRHHISMDFSFRSLRHKITAIPRYADDAKVQPLH